MTAQRAPPKTNAQWSEETTSTLLEVARAEFAQSGYAQASIDRIAARAGLSKGAVYYHFASKAGLFERVVRDAQHDLVRRIEARAVAATPGLAAIAAGCEAFLAAALDDELRQILLVDAPAVLGWSAWRAIDSEYGLGSLKEGLHECRRFGLAKGLDIDILAHLISGALNEAVFLVAESADRASSHRRIATTIRR